MYIMLNRIWVRLVRLRLYAFALNANSVIRADLLSSACTFGCSANVTGILRLPMTIILILKRSAFHRSGQPGHMRFQGCSDSFHGRWSILEYPENLNGGHRHEMRPAIHPG